MGPVELADDIVPGQIVMARVASNPASATVVTGAKLPNQGGTLPRKLG
jgi:hypothetical protein